VWIIDPFFIHRSPHPKAPTRPSTLEVLQAKKHTPIFRPFVAFTFGLVVEYIKEFGGASKSNSNKCNFDSFQQKNMHDFCHAPTWQIKGMFFWHIFYFQRLEQGLEVFIIGHRPPVGQNVIDYSRLHNFHFQLNGTSIWSWLRMEGWKLVAYTHSFSMCIELLLK